MLGEPCFEAGRFYFDIIIYVNVTELGLKG